MRYKKTIFGFLLSFIAISAHAGEKSNAIARQILSPRFILDSSLDISNGKTNLDAGVYFSNDTFETVRGLLESKRIHLKEVKKGTMKSSGEIPGKEGLPGLKDLKGSAADQDSKTILDHQMYSARMEDGSVVIVASHYFDLNEKKWIKKTNVTLISPVSPPAKSAPAGTKARSNPPKR